MAEISKVVLPSGSTYDLKDAYARGEIQTLRSNITGGMHYIGVTTTEVSDGSSQSPITISGQSVTPSSGDIVIYGDMQFIFSQTDNKWHQFGSTGSLKALAFKENASTTYTPTGTISGGTIEVNLSKSSQYLPSSQTSGGSVVDGQAAQCTLPTFSTTVSNETLTFSWNAGQFKANTPTQVTMPTFAATQVVSGVQSAGFKTAPVFVGDEDTIQVS